MRQPSCDQLSAHDSKTRNPAKAHMKTISDLRNAYRTFRFLVVCAVFRVIASIMPRNRKKIIFGAWWGRQFGDNPKYFMKFLLSQNAGYQCYWVGEEYLRDKIAAECPEVKFIRKGSWMLKWHLLTAKWAFFCIGMTSDISSFPTFGKVRLLSMWHGTRIKGPSYMDKPQPMPTGRSLDDRMKRWMMKLRRKCVTTLCDASFSSSLMVEHQPLYVPLDFSRDRSIGAGTAKIDFLIQNASNDALILKLRNKYGRLLGVPTDKKWFLYMPTWRNNLDLAYSFSRSVVRNRVDALLKEQNAIIIEKQHPQVIHALDIKEDHMGSIHIVSNAAMPDIDVQELQLCSQRMISDYSSLVCDFESMGRPVIHFTYDYDYYRDDDCGFEYPLEDIAAGPIVKTEEDLIKALEMTDEQLISMRGPRWQEPIDGERGTACETFARHVGLI